MDVPEQQYHLDCQREQRQARTQAQIRSEPAHLYVFIPPPGFHQGGECRRFEVPVSPPQADGQITRQTHRGKLEPLRHRSLGKPLVSAASRSRV
jgi:hypothetical protein